MAGSHTSNNNDNDVALLHWIPDKGSMFGDGPTSSRKLLGAC